MTARAWRSFFLVEYAHQLAVISDYASAMFPNVTFHEDAWSHLSGLEGDEGENVAKLVQHLGTLNDEAVRIWAANTETRARQAVLGSSGITASPESSNTRRSPKKMRLRDFRFEDKTIRCEWHTKLRPNINRVYFAVESEQVYVGTIIDHLPL